jgi:hypothetical protein
MGRAKKHILEKILDMLPARAAEIYMKEHCIPGDQIPCPKARDYAEKKGLLCPLAAELKPSQKIRKKRRKKSFFEKLFS